MNRDEESILCSNEECGYKGLHPSCLSLTSVKMPKTLDCPHCCRLPQFKKRGGTRKVSHATYQIKQLRSVHLYLQVKALTHRQVSRVSWTRLQKWKVFSPALFKFEKNAQQPQNNLEMFSMQKSYCCPSYHLFFFLWF